MLTMRSIVYGLVVGASLMGLGNGWTSSHQPGTRRRHQDERSQPDTRSLAESSQTEVENYHLWKPEEFKETLDEWKVQYPDLIRVTTAQEKYGLPMAGSATDCPFQDEPGCPNYIFTIQDFIVHPEDSSSSNSLPEVFWSGCLHGNERVGPTSVMEAATLLLESARCEALPRRSEDHFGKSNSTYGPLESQMVEAKTCRKVLKEKGVDDHHRKWLARLVSTRRIVVVPTANALGYYRNKRTEGIIDPNRDFPYDLQDPSICMQTIAGRTVNEIYREHMFQLALTFHAGMEVVSYEWGAPTWYNHLSPDDTAQDDIASAYSLYGGGWKKSGPYKHGTMNDLVYYVRGGMEDWAYAGSWDPDRVIQCDPKTFGGYDKSKTVYNNSTLRVFNMLVETSDQKEPRKQDLGTSLDVLDRDTTGNGHVSRNIRLALLAADLVEPYVAIVGVNNLPLVDDVVPLSGRGGRTCQKARAVSVAKNAKEVEIHWTVGGGLEIDNTEIWFARWGEVPTDQLDCLTQPQSLDGFTKGEVLSESSGRGKFSTIGSKPLPSSDSPMLGKTDGPLFTGKINLPSGLKHLDKIAVIVSARLDQRWTHQPNDLKPNKPPQSHVVNARTDPNWHHESAGKTIQGRLDWFSFPLTIVIGDFNDNLGSQDSSFVNTVELHSRFAAADIETGGVKPKSVDKDQLWFPLGLWESLGALAVFFAICVMLVSIQRSRQASRNVSKSENSSIFAAQGYSDELDDDDDESESDDDDDGEMELADL